MAEHHQEENSSKFSSVSSSSENRDSGDAGAAGGEGYDEEFYEEIEAPKFVDFTLPDHYHPDDRYWFCHRVGCDQKHEEEMDSEAIYKKFVLRVMAARSPNIKLRKALDRNASRTPIKCPLSAPPKSSRPRFSRMAVISSISEKTFNEKKRVVRSLMKPMSTPVTKTKPVAAKYLTTPRNKKCLPNPNSFRSVQNQKPTGIEVPKSRVAAKALVFQSPKKTIKVKTSVELRTPITKLCEGMNKLEISSLKKRAVGYSSKLSKNLNNNSSRKELSSSKVKNRPGKPLASRSSTSHDAKFGKRINGKVEKKFSNSEKNEGQDTKQELTDKKAVEEFEIRESSTQEETHASSKGPQPMEKDLNTSDGLEGEGDCLDLVEGKESRSQATNREVNSGNDDKENSCRRNDAELMDSDDKENAAVSDENRMHHTKAKQNGTKVFGMHDKSSQVKKVTQTQDSNLKEGPVMKFKKPKPTNPKPFRLRTDERGILKEANLEKKSEILTAALQSGNANMSTLPGKIQRKQGIDNTQKPKAASSATPESNAIQRLEKFKKMRSPLQKRSSVRPQGPDMTKKEITSFLIPGQKLEVIQEMSPEVLQLKSDKKPTASDIPFTKGRRPVTVAREPNFQSTHVPRDCTKKVK